MTYVFYHISDLDGHCSGAIVRKFLEDQGKKEDTDFKMVPIDYGMEYDTSKIADGSTVYMVDYTIQPYEKTVELSKRCDLTVYDHHKTPIEPLTAAKIKGVYEVGTRAACRIVWDALFSKEYGHSKIIHLISEWDNWNNNNLDSDWENEVTPFQMGMQSLSTNPVTRDGWIFWQRVFDTVADTNENEFVETTIGRGKTLIEYQDKMDRSLMNNAFELDFEGLKFLVVNGGKGSPRFKSRWNNTKYDAMMSFQLVENKYWTISLYTDKPDIDLSAIAKKHGGGGHIKASGFQVKDIYEIIGKR